MLLYCYVNLRLLNKMEPVADDFLSDAINALISDGNDTSAGAGAGAAAAAGEEEEEVVDIDSDDEEEGGEGD